MEKIWSEMFEDGMFSNIFFTDSNPAIVNIEKITKESDELKRISETKTYNLIRLDVVKEELIKPLLLNRFFANLNFLSTNKEIKYFDRGFFKNLFTDRDVELLLNEILDFDWIITSSNIIKELSKVDGFKKMAGSKATIKLIGRFDCQFKTTLVFELPDNDNLVYCGNFDSITPVINKNIINNNIEYLFETKDNLKKLIIL